MTIFRGRWKYDSYLYQTSPTKGFDLLNALDKSLVLMNSLTDTNTG